MSKAKGLIPAILAAAAVLPHGAAIAQNAGNYVPGLAGSCVSNFWDSSNYGWMSFRNNCGQAIHLTIVAFNGTGPFGHGGAMDIAPGASANIGQSPAEVGSAGGGYSTYPCPAGYVAVDANGRTIDSANEQFNCKLW